jgi:hypothetical protein
MNGLGFSVPIDHEIGKCRAAGRVEQLHADCEVDEHGGPSLRRGLDGGTVRSPPIRRCRFNWWNGAKGSLIQARAFP